MNAITGLWICYACGAKGTLSQLVGELTGNPDDITAVHEFLIKGGLERINNPTDTIEQEPEVDWSTFYTFNNPPEKRLLKRKIDPERARKYGLRWDEKERGFVIPIVSRFGELQGWQLKSSSKVLNYPVGVKKSRTLFGIEKFTASTAILVESPLDVVRYASAFDGYQALASFGTAVSAAQLQLLVEVADRVIIAMDNDEAGIKASKNICRAVSRPRQGVYWLSYQHTHAKDIGDMTDDEVASAIESSSIVPPWVTRPAR
jgi:hypothetical protein